MDGHDDSFYVYDLAILRLAYSEWVRSFPAIRPFYAVKCNPDERVCETLANLGCSFDCASPAEIELVMDLGVQDDRIIYANPCKHPRDAAMYGNLLTTFDSESELTKLGTGSSVLLRIREDDPEARCNLGVKYGAQENQWRSLIEMCKFLGHNLVGISFHVGSLAKSPRSYVNALAKTRAAMDLAIWFGFHPTIVDIGGGFSTKNIKYLAPLINEALSLYFPVDFTIIAEPGRFFAENVATLFTPVIGIKDDNVTISESLYGSFNCILFDHATPEISLVVGADGFEISGAKSRRRIFGSTCDGADIISNGCQLVDVTIGDWLVWAGMGAYTSAATTAFNGMPFNARSKLYLN
jgi:ornithine decarboxylase